MCNHGRVCSSWIDLVISIIIWPLLNFMPYHFLTYLKYLVYSIMCYHPNKLTIAFSSELFLLLPCFNFSHSQLNLSWICLVASTYFYTTWCYLVTTTNDLFASLSPMYLRFWHFDHIWDYCFFGSHEGYNHCVHKMLMFYHLKHLSC
jgi:hypothetical protein